MSNGFRRIDQLSSWRRIALHIWRRPSDPTVYGNLEINMRKSCAYLETVNRLSPEFPVTVTHLTVKAIATALAEYPKANAIVSGKRLHARDTADVYCQVATHGGEDLSGVKVATADHKTVIEIAHELSRAVDHVHKGDDPGSERSKRAIRWIPQRALGGFLRAMEFLTYDLGVDLSRFGIAYDQFGGAMVSNVGIFGIDNGLAPLVPVSRTPIVLLVGKVRDKPTVEDGEIVIAPMLTIGCTFDHRVIDGYQAGAMAKTVISCLEDPFIRFGLPSRPSSADGRFVMGAPDTSGTDPIDSEYKDRKPGFVRAEDRGAAKPSR